MHVDKKEQKLNFWNYQPPWYKCLTYDLIEYICNISNQGHKLSASFYPNLIFKNSFRIINNSEFAFKVFTSLLLSFFVYLKIETLGKKLG